MIVAPLSGHHATLLRGTVKAMLPQHSVYITDWSNARDVPLTLGTFDLDDCIDYLMSIFRVLGPNLHVMAVCQPAVPVLAAVSLMEEVCDPHTPASIILLGGPIDTRVNPTAINRFAEQHGTEWFRQNVITKVPFMYWGFLRDVYPGFIQLSSFMSINLDRHITRHQEFFLDLMRGDQVRPSLALPPPRVRLTWFRCSSASKPTRACRSQPESCSHSKPRSTRN